MVALTELRYLNITLIISARHDIGWPRRQFRGSLDLATALVEMSRLFPQRTAFGGTIGEFGAEEVPAALDAPSGVIGAKRARRPPEGRPEARGRPCPHDGRADGGHPRATFMKGARDRWWAALCPGWGERRSDENLKPTSGNHDPASDE